MSALLDTTDLRAAGVECSDAMGALSVSILADEVLARVAEWAEGRAFRACGTRCQDWKAIAAECAEIQEACNVELHRRAEARAVCA